jgi:hypothetical protein
MQEGFIPGTKNGSEAVPLWYAGKPETSFMGGLKLSGRPQHPVATYCCTQCGCLEAYARGT